MRSQLALGRLPRVFSGDVLDALLRSGADTVLSSDEIRYAAEHGASALATAIHAERTAGSPPSLVELSRRGVRRRAGPGLLVELPRLPCAADPAINACLFYGVVFKLR